MADPGAQAKHTARVLIGEARARRLLGHGFWCMFRMAQSARLRAESLPRPVPSALPIQPELFA
jgi:predicted ATP-dependent Lon-type protease